MPRGYALHTDRLAQAVRRIAVEDGRVPGAVDAPARVYTERGKPSSHPNTLPVHTPHQDRRIRLPRHLHHDGDIPHTEITLIVLLEVLPQGVYKVHPGCGAHKLPAERPGYAPGCEEQHQKGRTIQERLSTIASQGHSTAGLINLERGSICFGMSKVSVSKIPLGVRSSKLINTPGILNQPASQGAIESVDIQGVINAIDTVHRHNR